MAFSAVAIGTMAVGAKVASNANKRANKAIEAALSQSKPEEAPKDDPVEKMKKADAAAVKQRRNTAAAGAQANTILTSPGGLGELAPGQGEKKSLLGY